MTDLKVYGAPWCPDCKRTKKFLGEHRVAYDWIDIDEDPAGLRYVEELQRGGRSIPTLVFADGSHLIEPANDELARKLGLHLAAERAFYDIAIVGGGPAGLAAAIYAAREGLEVIVIDRGGLGGQAGVTERIDNYPGFPDGIAGGELADRFVQQARRYGVELLSAVEVVGVAREQDDLVFTLGTGAAVSAHAGIIATGSSYRRLDVPGEEALIGAGVHFCATCDGPFYKGADELLVVGGGNSALEEGLFLAQFAATVRIVAHGELRASQLLQDKIRSHPQFSVHTNTDIIALEGDRKLQGVAARNRSTGEEYRWNPKGAFIFIGQDPNSGLLRDTVRLDSRGFIETDGRFGTTLPGLFAAGDVRRGSTKQLGAAVGEGITALLMAREFLREHHHVPTPSAED